MVIKFFHLRKNCFVFNPLSANPAKWSNKLKHTQSVFDHFAGLVLKGLKVLCIFDEFTIFISSITAY